MGHIRPPQVGYGLSMALASGSGICFDTMKSKMRVGGVCFEKTLDLLPVFYIHCLGYKISSHGSIIQALVVLFNFHQCVIAEKEHLIFLGILAKHTKNTCMYVIMRHILRSRADKSNDPKIENPHQKFFIALSV